MKRENQEKLMKDFPEMFSLTEERKGGIWPIAFGIECGDGWFDIIYDLTKKIHELDPQVKVAQIKEKFGGLRYYITSSCNDDVWDAIEQAEIEALKTCEVCGSKGDDVDVRGSGWIKTLCVKCDEIREKEKSEWRKKHNLD